MIRARRIAGRPFPGREPFVSALRKAELSDQALINFAALSRFSGDAWRDRLDEARMRTWTESGAWSIPAQRRYQPRPTPSGVPHARRR